MEVASVEDRADYKIVFLNEDNYVTWKWHMSMILTTKGFTNCIKATDAGSPIDQDPVRQNKAAALIASALSEANMQRVINCSTAFDIWAALEATFENKSSTQRTMLLEKFHSYRINNISSISRALGDIQATAAKLKSLGASIDDETTISVILKALPDVLKTWKSTWRMVNAVNPNLNNLITSLMAEVNELEQPEDSALYVNHKQRAKPVKRYFKRNNGPNKEDICNFCKNKGHWARDCIKLQTKLAEEKNKEYSNANVAMMAISPREALEPTQWIADSGCSMHMTPNQEYLENYQEFVEPKQITLGDNSKIPAIGAGRILTSFGSLEKVHYVPKLSHNLLSISAASQKGITATYNQEGIKLAKDGKVFLKGGNYQGIYALNLKVSTRAERAFVTATLAEWHLRLGHVSIATIRKMAKAKAVEGLQIKSSEEDVECEDCALAKCKQVPHQERSSSKVKKAGVSLHMDTVGPFKEESLGGAFYMVLCKDEASSYKLFRLVTRKCEIPDKVKQMISQAQLETKNKTLRLVTDNGSEFVNKALQEYLGVNGIIHECSAPHTPQQNGFIEREVRTVVEAARTLLIQAKMKNNLWAEAVNTAIYVLNRVLTSTHEDKTPYELWFGKVPNIKNLHRFGQTAIVYYRDYKQTKWTDKGTRQRFVGYEKFNTFRFYDDHTEKVYISCDAKFMENDEMHSKKTAIVSEEGETNETVTVNDLVELPSLQWDNEITYQTPEGSLASRSFRTTLNNSPGIENIVEEPNDSVGNVVSVREEMTTDEEEEQISKEIREYNRLDRIKKQNERAEPSDIHPQHVLPETLRPLPKTKYHAKLVTIEAETDPSSYAEAMARKDKLEWVKAMKDEIDSLNKNNVWVLVDKPKQKGINIVTNKWVFKIKRDPNGKIERYRARLVARGFSQRHGVDYFETYAPVANMVSIRMLLANAAEEKLEMAQFDVKTAFLYGELDETVYMEQPEGFCVDSKKVCLLKRSLYGLKQSPRQWNLKFSNFLKKMNLTVSENDNCIFYRKDPLLLIAIYVDDGIIFARNKEEIDKILDQLGSEFEIHQVKVSAFLGFQIHRGTEGEITINQPSYIRTILKRFNMDGCKPVDTPTTLTKTVQDDTTLNETTPYREAIGSLMYAAVTTRIDITHAVNLASRKVSNPTEQDWIAVKRIFRYLNTKEDYGITYKHTGSKILSAFCDADFAGDESTSKSTTGFIMTYNNSPIYWKTQRQALITLSSTEAEFVGICSTVKELLWVRRLAQELNVIDSHATTLYCDNESANRIANNEKCAYRTRHIGAQARYPREQIEQGEVKIEHIKAEEQLADMLTKPLTTKKFVSNNFKLMSTILALCAIAFIQPTVAGYFFEQVSPVIWIPTDYKVQTGVTTYTLEVTHTSPCDVIPTEPKHKMANVVYTYEDYALYREAKKQCEEVHELQWETRIDELVSEASVKQLEVIDRPSTYNNGLVRQERDTGLIRYERNPFIIIIAVMIISSIIVENLIGFSISWLNPNSDTNKIKNLQTQAETDKARIDELEKKFNNSQALINSLEERLGALSTRVQATEMKIDLLNRFSSEVLINNMMIQALINEAGSRLEYIIEAFRKGKAAMRQIALLWNLDRLHDIDPELTIFEEVTRKSNVTIELKIHVKEVTNDTSIYQIYTIPHWVVNNVQNEPTMVRYNGRFDYLMYNHSAACVKGLHLSNHEQLVLDECSEKTYIDPRLNSWVNLTKAEIEAYRKPTVKSILTNNYIYCFGYNITISGEEHICPTFPFKLNIHVPFKTEGHTYNAKVIKLSGKTSQWKPLDSTLPGSLLLPAYSNHPMLSNLETFRKANFEVESILYSTMWFGLGTTVILVITIFGAMYYTQKKKYIKVRVEETNPYEQSQQREQASLSSSAVELRRETKTV